MHPQPVARDRVDLAVVRNRSKRLRQGPIRRGIRAEPLMEHRERRCEPLVAQIEIEPVERVRRHQRLVYDGRCRQRDDGQRQGEPAGETFDAKPGKIQHLVGRRRRCSLECDDCLEHHWRRGALRREDGRGIHLDGTPHRHCARIS